MLRRDNHQCALSLSPRQSQGRTTGSYSRRTEKPTDHNPRVTVTQETVLLIAHTYETLHFFAINSISATSMDKVILFLYSDLVLTTNKFPVLYFYVLI